MDDYQLRDMAASACQEALSFGVSEDAFMKLARSVRERCARECEERAAHQNGPHVVTLELNQMACALRGQHDFRA